MIELESTPRTREHDYWSDLAVRAPELSMQACVNGANALISALSILIAAHLSVVALGDVNSRKYGVSYDILIEVVWLFALVLSVSVALPERWGGFKQCPATVRRGYEALLRSKYRRTAVAAGLAAAGIIGLIYALAFGAPPAP